jgi:Zn-dependent M28 family amino/carboxypeptidase
MRYLVLSFLLSLSLKAEDHSLRLRTNLKLEDIRAHQKALQEVADQNNGNRMATSAGYRQSVAYVVARLRAAGYEVRLQDFTLRLASDQSPPELKILEPHEYNFVADVDFSSMSFSGVKELNAPIEAIDLKIPLNSPNDSTSGCESQDFEGFKPGNIALIQRGGCSFSKKVAHAKAALASGVIIFNDGSDGHLELISTRLDSSSADFPVLGASFAVGNIFRGKVLKGPTGIAANIKINIHNSAKLVQNIIAETAQGDSSRVVAVGAHLDSVQSGAGINDNASGSATILKVAELYSTLKLTPRNKLRFIWFGAEEFGLVGSEFYVDSLTTQEKKNIMAMLNFDMLGSPNYVRFVYDGDNSGRSEASAVAGPQGSQAIEKIFLDYFAALNLATHPTAFNGRSDYGPFIAVGIPAGGLFSGAEGVKSSRMAETYGGIAGVAYDACYHRSCDNFTGTEGLALKSLAELSLAAAHAVAYLGQTEQNIRPLYDIPVATLPEPEWEYKGHLIIR